MISIRVEKRFLELSRDTKVKVEFIFPNPTEDNIPVSVVQWFDVPSTEENDITFEHCKHIEIGDKTRIYENAYFEAAGISKKGKMIVNSVTTTMYKVSIAFNPFPDGFRDILLNELILADYGLGANTDAIIATAKSYSQDNYPDTDMAFPMIYMGNFYGSDINTNFLYFINHYLNSAFLKNQQLVFDNGNVNCLVPHFYLLAAIDAVMSSGGFNITGEFINDADISKLIIFNNYAIDKLDESYIVIARTTSDKIYASNTSRRRNLVFDIDEDINSIFTISTATYTISQEGRHIIDFSFNFKADESPDNWYMSIEMYVGGVLQSDALYTINDTNWGSYSHQFIYDAGSTGAAMNFKIDCYAIGEPDETYDFRYRNAVIYINPIEYSTVNVYESTVSMQNHLPQITVSTFINNIIKMFCLAPFFSEEKKEIEFVFWNSILDFAEILDLTDYYIKDSEEIEIFKNVYEMHMPFTEGEIDRRAISEYEVEDSIFKKDLPAYISNINLIYYIKDLNRWMISYYDEIFFNYGWKPYRDNFENINESISEATDISIDVNTLQMNVSGYGQSELQGSSPEFGLGTTEFPFKLLFYHGICSSFIYDYLPYASSNQYKPDGTQNGSFALRLNDTDGLYATFWEKWIDYYENHDLVTLRLRIDEHILAQINSLFTAGSRTRKIRIMNRNYIPVQIDVEIGMNGITNCEAKLR